MVGDGGSDQRSDAFGGSFFRSDGGLYELVLGVGRGARLRSCVLGLHSVRVAGGSDGCGGGIVENTVGRDAVGGFDGCKGIHGSFGEREHPLA